MRFSQMIKLDKEELVDIIRKNEFEIRNLRKELKRTSARWRDYYRHKAWKDERRKQ